MTYLDLLRCGAFALTPLVVAGAGLWAIVRFVGIKGRLAFVLGTAVVGATFFAASLVGMVMDPRFANFGIAFSLRTSALVGLGTMVFALLFTPILRGLMALLRCRGGNVR